MILKCDQEPAIKDLQSEIRKELWDELKCAARSIQEEIRDVRAKIERKEKLSLKLAERDLALCKQIKELSEKQAKVRTDRLKTMQGVSNLQAELEQIVEKCFSMPNVEDELPQPSSVPNELWASKDWKAMETAQGNGEQLKKRMAQLAGVNVPEADTENNIHGGGGAASDGGPTPQPGNTPEDAVVMLYLREKRKRLGVLEEEVLAIVESIKKLKR